MQLSPRRFRAAEFNFSKKMLYRFLLYNLWLRPAGMEYITFKQRRPVLFQNIDIFDFCL